MAGNASQTIFAESVDWQIQRPSNFSNALVRTKYGDSGPVKAGRSFGPEVRAADWQLTTGENSNSAFARQSAMQRNLLRTSLSELLQNLFAAALEASAFGRQAGLDLSSNLIGFVRKSLGSIGDALH